MKKLVVLLVLLASSVTGSVDFKATTDIIAWTGGGRDGLPHEKQARVPRVIFVR